MNYYVIIDNKIILVLEVLSSLDHVSRALLTLLDSLKICSLYAG